MNTVLSHEIVGVIASILILFSICANTTKKNGILILRGLNILGSLIYIYYGYLIHSYSIILLDSVAVIINTVYMFKHIKEYDKWFIIKNL